MNTPIFLNEQEDLPGFKIRSLGGSSSLTNGSLYVVTDLDVQVVANEFVRMRNRIKEMERGQGKVINMESDIKKHA